MERYVRARRGDFSFDPDTIKLFAFQKHGRQKWTANKLEFVEAKYDGGIIEPFFEMDRHEAQKFMDDLWDCGLRPSEGSGSAGAMKKTENHLADMRKIVFFKLGIKEKEESQV